MEKDSNAWAAKRAPPSARAHAKCVGPRKVRGPTQNAQAHTKCEGCVMSGGTPSAGKRAKCVGRGSIARAPLSARAAIAWIGEWAALPTHLPRTCHSMPMQCNRGSTRVGHDEPQSPGTLRVNSNLIKAHTSFGKFNHVCQWPYENNSANSTQPFTITCYQFSNIRCTLVGN